MPRAVPFLLFALCGALPVFAVLQPAKIFSDHMVLQRDAAVPFWGKADAGAAVKVAFAGQSVEAKADKEGRWKLKLEPTSWPVRHTQAPGFILVTSIYSSHTTVLPSLPNTSWRLLDGVG